MKKKLIEVALPLEFINKASAHEKQPGIGAHPRGLHLWWARRPLAAARAVIFAQMVDDPSANTGQFPTEKEQEIERQRLFQLIEELVKWENTTNQHVLKEAREEIWKSWRSTCEENKDHPRATELFNPKKLPAFYDLFAGGGALPLEAQRLGLDAYASDLNPVAVLINKSMIEIPPMFANRPPVNPDSRKQKGIATCDWKDASGLAEDIRYYGQKIYIEAEKRIGHLYPQIEITEDMTKERPDLKPYIGHKLTVIAWLWARTVKSPNPAFAHVDIPLASTFMLCTKKGKEAYVEPMIEGDNYRFTVKIGKPTDFDTISKGTKLSRGANFKCLMSETPIKSDYIKAEGMAGRMGFRMMAIIAVDKRGRIYLPPTQEMESIAFQTKPEWKPETTISGSTQYLGVKPYGMKQFSQLFTDRQLVALNTFSDLVQETYEQVKKDTVSLHLKNNSDLPEESIIDANDYAASIVLYLAFAVSRLADYNSSLTTWKPSGEQVMHTYQRQALSMNWDFPESNVLGNSSICWINSVKYTADNLEVTAKNQFGNTGHAFQIDAANQSICVDKIVSTDPPYYDNVPYADLSDFFYVWLRRSIKSFFPNLFTTLVVPKSEELVAFAYRHEGKNGADSFFLNGMTRTMQCIAEQAHPAFPVTIYYAFKQSESDNDVGIISTGWDTFINSLLNAGLSITGTWPMRTELGNRLRGMDANALASSIVLVCRKRNSNAPIVTRREFLTALKTELPEALKHLQHGNIAPVDLAQAAIGPGMAVYTRYSKVLDAEGKAMTVREALALINETLDEVLTEQEGDFDADSRWALAWFEQYGFDMGEYGVAETLSKAKNTSVSGMVEAGILESKSGKARILKPSELPADWDPTVDERLTVWEIVHHLIRVSSLRIM
jgi:putative DNA methylase